MTVPVARSQVRSPHWHRFAAVVVLAIVATVVAVAATSSAAPQSRRAEPFMAGTLFSTANGSCTAGLILKDNSRLSGITEYRRSVRFILTAGHCGSVGDRFTTAAGTTVGDVVWKSSTHDFLLVRVEPRLDRGVAPGCIPGSQTLPCVAISSHYYPRAVGRVFTGGPLQSESAPVNGTTMSGATIAISGGVGGTTIGHTSIQRPQGGPADPPHAQDLSFTRGPMSSIGPGDSGAPLLSHNGNVFGVLNGAWGGAAGPNGARYTKVSLFFAEQSGYALAPPE
jgi:hypothetical protein